MPPPSLHTALKVIPHTDKKAERKAFSQVIINCLFLQMPCPRSGWHNSAVIQAVWWFCVAGGGFAAVRFHLRGVGLTNRIDWGCFGIREAQRAPKWAIKTDKQWLKKGVGISRNRQIRWNISLAIYAEVFVFELFGGHTLVVSFIADVTFILILTARFSTSYEFQSDVALSYLNIYLYPGCLEEWQCVWSARCRSFLWTEFIVVRDEGCLSQQSSKTHLCRIRFGIDCMKTTKQQSDFKEEGRWAMYGEEEE